MEKSALLSDPEAKAVSPAGLSRGGRRFSLESLFVIHSLAGHRLGEPKPDVEPWVPVCPYRPASVVPNLKPFEVWSSAFRVYAASDRPEAELRTRSGTLPR